MRINSDRKFLIGLDRDQAWEAVCNTENYRKWWPWLRGFEGTGMTQGDVWRCVVHPPLPYTLRFSVTLDTVVPKKLIDSTVAGDVVGTARCEVEEHEHGFQVRLVSSVAPGSRMLRAAALIAGPIVRMGHDWVLDEGVRLFTEKVAATIEAEGGEY